MLPMFPYLEQGRLTARIQLVAAVGLFYIVPSHMLRSAWTFKYDHACMSDKYNMSFILQPEAPADDTINFRHGLGMCEHNCKVFGLL
jgi:hypothetical protein